MLNLPSLVDDLNNNVPLFIFYIAITVIGGLGLFLYGIKMMGDNLKTLAGAKLKMIIEKSTNTPIKGVLVGIIVTIILQSSSGTDALVISLVGAGLMTLTQAVGVILGANIGTTITAFLVGLKIQKYALVFVGVGALMVFFFKKKKKQTLGKVILGLGFLFFGLDLMSTGLGTLTSTYQSQTEALFTWLSSYPILGYLVGVLFTAGVQSSAATIAIVQSLYAKGAIQSLTGALALTLGANLGTTITGVIASMGASKEARQVAFISVMQKLLWTVIFMCLIVPFTALVSLIERTALVGIYGTDVADYGMMSIAIGHMIFNIVATFVMVWFAPAICRLTQRVFRYNSKDDSEAIVANLTDYTLIYKSPALAAEFVKRNIDYMGRTVIDFFALAHDYCFNEDSHSFEKGLKLEQTINSLDKRIHDYLIKMTRESIDKEVSNLISKYLDTIGNLERIGDHCANLMEFAQEGYELKVSLSEDGKRELQEIFAVVKEMLDNANQSLQSGDKAKAELVLVDEVRVDDMEETFRKHHFVRINEGTCTHSIGDSFVDMLSNLERIGDHCDNIANTVIDDEYCATSEFNH